MEHTGHYFHTNPIQMERGGLGVCVVTAPKLSHLKIIKQVFEFVVCWNKVALSLYSLNILVSDNLYGVNNIFDHSGHDISDFLTQHD